MSLAHHRLSLQEISSASALIDPVFQHTPQYLEPALGNAFKGDVLIKIETLNPVGSFKGRGADYIVQQKKGTADQLICASAGNFGLAMAYACRRHKMSLTVFAGAGANQYKLERILSLGATVEIRGDDFDGAKEAAREEASVRKILFIEDGLDIETLAGAGTIGLELLTLPQQPDAWLIPLGNAALFTGVARVLRAHHPHVKLIGIQAAKAPAMAESIARHTLVTYPTAPTIADGIAVRLPIPQSLTDLEGLIDETMLVEEEQLLSAIQLLHREARIITEPAGAAGVAALLAQPSRFQNRSTGTILCGANLTREQMESWL